VSERRYTLDEIKAAFWRQFHQSGELWFPYASEGVSAEECDAVTRMQWEDFVDALPSDEQEREGGGE
jgi:hypothetical protein